MHKFLKRLVGWSNWSRADIINATIAVSTIGLMWFTYLLWRETRNAVEDAKASIELARTSLVSSQRAWLSPTGARVIGQLAKGQQLEIEISYRNFGREPAIISAEYDPVAETKYANATTGRAQDIPAFTNATCYSARPVGRGLVVYPGSAKDYTNILILPDDSWDANILSGELILYVTGCFTYESISSIHHSAYCFYLKPEPHRAPETWNFYDCGSGNFAD